MNDFATLNDAVRSWMLGDEEAAHFAMQVWQAAQEWDDLEDEGKCNHNSLLSWLAFTKEYIPYFQRNAALLRPALLQMYLSWRAANVLERGDHNDVSKAYMLRAGVYGVFHLMTWIAGGDDWAAAKGPEIWRMYGETLAELKEEMTCPDPL